MTPQLHSYITKLLADNSISNSECAVVFLLDSKPMDIKSIRLAFKWSQSKTYRIVQNLIDKKIILKNNELKINYNQNEWNIKKFPETEKNCYKNELAQKFTENFTEKLQKDLKNYLLRKRINSDDCDDIIQESGMKAYKVINKFENNSFRGWMFQITKNTMKDYFKRKKPLQLMEFEEIVDESDNNEYVEFINKLNQLPDQFKIPLLLSRVYEVPYPDIAVFCGITETNLRVRISRAISLLFG